MSLAPIPRSRRVITTRYTRFLAREGSVTPAAGLGELANRFFADTLAGQSVNWERYSTYVPSSIFAGGSVPQSVFAADRASGIACIRAFAEAFDPNNDFGFVVERAALVTADTIAPNEVSVATTSWWDPAIGDRVALRWDGASDTISVGGIPVTRGVPYQISSLGGTPGGERFVRIAPGGTKTSNASVPIANGRALYCRWKNLGPNFHADRWYASIQRALNAGMWVIATPFGNNLWDVATAQGGESPGDGYFQYRSRFGWDAVNLLLESWVEHIVATISDPDNRLILEWQNEDVAVGANDAAREAASKPRREEGLTRMRAKAPGKLLMAGGADFGDPESLAQIVPQDDPGIVYKCHQYADSSNVNAVWGAAIAWRTATGRPFFIAEHGRLADEEPDANARRDQFIAMRDGLRALGIPSPAWWAETYQAGERLSDIVGETKSYLINLAPVFDERPLPNAVPTITGTATLGQTLTLVPGTWFGRAPITTAVQWQRNGIDVTDATGATYLLGAADVGARIRCRVTATNPLGMGTIATDETGLVAGPAQPPLNTELPSILGGAQVPQTVIAQPGTWTGDPTITFAYQWRRNGVPISGATASFYTLVVADVAALITVAVTGTNPAGNATAVSAPIGPILADAGPIGGQATTMAWSLGTTATVVAGGLANNDLPLEAGRHDHRADVDAQVTTANAAVSSWASGQSLLGTLTQGTAGNRPAHVAASDIVQFTGATSGTDVTNGKWLTFGGTGETVVTRFGQDTNRLGVVYLLFRFAALPTWNVRLFAAGRNSNTFNDLNNGYFLEIQAGGIPRIMRAGPTSGDRRVAGPSVAIPTNRWIAAALVINDDRVTPGSSMNITRLFLKTNPGAGVWEAMGGWSTGAISVTGGASPTAFVNRQHYNVSGAAGGIGNWDLHSIAVDYDPPTTDAGIEAQLDKLRARVSG